MSFFSEIYNLVPSLSLFFASLVIGRKTLVAAGHVGFLPTTREAKEREPGTKFRNSKIFEGKN